jgi:hypothetical protein
LSRETLRLPAFARNFRMLFFHSTAWGFFVTNRNALYVALAALTLSASAFAQSVPCSGGESVGPFSSVGSCKGGDASPSQPAAPTDLTLTYAVGGSGIFATPGMFSHPFNNLGAATALGPIPVAANANLITGLDTDPTGATVFAIAGFGTGITPRLVTVNRTTGALTTIANLSGLATGGIALGMATDPRNGTIYIAEFVATPQAMNLRTVNATTGATTLVGNMSATQLITDMAINCQGVMFGLQSSNDQLVSVNTTTGATAAIGALGFDTGNLVDGSGIDFDNQDGTLYANLHTFVTGTGVTASRYGTINTATGASTGVATPTAIGKPAAINTCATAPVQAPAVPVPTMNAYGLGTLALIMGLVGFAVTRRRNA